MGTSTSKPTRSVRSRTTSSKGQVHRHPLKLTDFPTNVLQRILFYCDLPTLILTTPFLCKPVHKLTIQALAQRFRALFSASLPAIVQKSIHHNSKRTCVHYLSLCEDSPTWFLSKLNLGHCPERRLWGVQKDIIEMMAEATHSAQDQSILLTSGIRSWSGLQHWNVVMFGLDLMFAIVKSRLVRQAFEIWFSNEIEKIDTVLLPFWDPEMTEVEIISASGSKTKRQVPSVRGLDLNLNLFKFSQAQRFEVIHCFSESLLTSVDVLHLLPNDDKPLITRGRVSLQQILTGNLGMLNEISEKWIQMSYRIKQMNTEKKGMRPRYRSRTLSGLSTSSSSTTLVPRDYSVLPETYILQKWGDMVWHVGLIICGLCFKESKNMEVMTVMADDERTAVDIPIFKILHEEILERRTDKTLRIVFNNTIPQRYLATLEGNPLPFYCEIHAPFMKLSSVHLFEVSDVLVFDARLHSLSLDGSLLRLKSSARVGILMDALTTNKTLKELSLRRNRLGDRDARTIAQMLKRNTALRILDLSHNCITDDGSEKLAKAIEINTALSALSLTHNDISSTHLWETVMIKNKVLKYLNLRENSIHPLNALIFFRALAMSTSMEYVNLHCNLFSLDNEHMEIPFDYIHDCLLKTLEANKTLKVIIMRVDNLLNYPQRDLEKIRKSLTMAAQVSLRLCVFVTKQSYPLSEKSFESLKFLQGPLTSQSGSLLEARILVPDLHTMHRAMMQDDVDAELEEELHRVAIFRKGDPHNSLESEDWLFLRIAAQSCFGVAKVWGPSDSYLVYHV